MAQESLMHVKKAILMGDTDVFTHHCTCEGRLDSGQESGVQKFAAKSAYVNTSANEKTAKSTGHSLCNRTHRCLLYCGLTRTNASRYYKFRRPQRYFGSDAQSWMNLQASYDLEVAEIALAERIEREVKPLQDAA
jgi:hypothetical protein